MIKLPPFVMRPNLQFGKFLRASEAVLASLERFKYRYLHPCGGCARGLSRPGFSTSPRLRDYIYPPSDEIERIAKKFRLNP